MTIHAANSAEFVAYVGIDWADQAHAICELTANDRPPKAHSIEQKPEAIAKWVSRLRADYGPGLIAICLELCRGGLVSALLEFEGIVLFPKVTKRLLVRHEESKAALVVYETRRQPDGIKQESRVPVGNSQALFRLP